MLTSTSHADRARLEWDTTALYDPVHVRQEHLVEAGSCSLNKTPTSFAISSWLHDAHTPNVSSGPLHMTPNDTVPTAFDEGMVAGATSCSSRYLRRGPWLPEEDSILGGLVSSQGPNNWVRISQHMRHRSPKQCRERWHQNLKPTLNHDPISSAEGDVIVHLVDAMGKRWAEIARRLGNRSDNVVKNWWNAESNRRKLHQPRTYAGFPVYGPSTLESHEVPLELCDRFIDIEFISGEARQLPHPPWHPPSFDIGLGSIHPKRSRDSGYFSRHSCLSIHSNNDLDVAVDSPDRVSDSIENHKNVKVQLHASDERPEKCIFATCVYFAKGFARRSDRTRHLLTHYKREIICPAHLHLNACGERFQRLDLFKRHLRTVHAVSKTQRPLKAAPDKNETQGQASQSICSLCSESFATVQHFYGHLDDCVLKILETVECSQEADLNGAKDCSFNAHDSPADGSLSPIASQPSNSGCSSELSFVGASALDDESWRPHNNLLVSSKTAALRDETVALLLRTYIRRKLSGTQLSPQPSHTTSGSSFATSSTSGSSQSLTASSTSKSLQTSCTSKRSCDDVNEDDEGDGTSKRRRRSAQDQTALAKKLFACPYAKFDRTRYSEANPAEKHYRGCSSSYLRDIARMKQHLYRVHRRPSHYCVRCYLEFADTDALESHSRDTPCVAHLLCPFGEKMKSDQLTAIKRRVMGQDSEKVWFDIFGILFPGADLPSSPFAEDPYESAEIDSFLTFFEREAPSRIANTATPMLCGSDCPQELQEMTEQILESCITRLIQMYRQGELQNPDLDLQVYE